MNTIIFAKDIKAVLEDNTEVTDVTAHIIDDKRVYKTADDTVLTGTKKIKTIKFATFLVPPEILPYNMDNENI